jgi:hypothetical protein
VYHAVQLHKQMNVPALLGLIGMQAGAAVGLDSLAANQKSAFLHTMPFNAFPPLLTPNGTMWDGTQRLLLADMPIPGGNDEAFEDGRGYRDTELYGSDNTALDTLALMGLPMPAPPSTTDQDLDALMKLNPQVDLANWSIAYESLRFSWSRITGQGNVPIPTNHNGMRCVGNSCVPVCNGCFVSPTAAKLVAAFTQRAAQNTLAPKRTTLASTCTSSAGSDMFTVAVFTALKFKDGVLTSKLGEGGMGLNCWNDYGSVTDITSYIKDNDYARIQAVVGVTMDETVVDDAASSFASIVQGALKDFVTGDFSTFLELDGGQELSLQHKLDLFSRDTEEGTIDTVLRALTLHGGSSAINLSSLSNVAGFNQFGAIGTYTWGACMMMLAYGYAAAVWPFPVNGTTPFHGILGQRAINWLASTQNMVKALASDTNAKPLMGNDAQNLKIIQGVWETLAKKYAPDAYAGALKAKVVAPASSSSSSLTSTVTREALLFGGHHSSGNSSMVWVIPLIVLGVMIIVAILYFSGRRSRRRGTSSYWERRWQQPAVDARGLLDEDELQ